MTFRGRWEDGDVTDVHFADAVRALDWGAEWVTEPSRLAGALADASRALTDSLVEVVGETWETPARRWRAVGGRRHAHRLPLTASFTTLSVAGVNG